MRDQFMWVFSLKNDGMKIFDGYLKENHTQAEIDSINDRALQKANSCIEFKNFIAYALKKLYGRKAHRV